MLNMPPMVEEAWEAQHKPWISPLEKSGRCWAATPGKVCRGVHSCLEAPELLFITEPCLQPHSPAEGRRGWGGSALCMGQGWHGVSGKASLT